MKSTGTIVITETTLNDALSRFNFTDTGYVTERPHKTSLCRQRCHHRQWLRVLSSIHICGFYAEATEKGVRTPTQIRCYNYIQDCGFHFDSSPLIQATNGHLQIRRILIYTVEQRRLHHRREEMPYS
jgi:hypothetical protein